MMLISWPESETLMLMRPENLSPEMRGVDGLVLRRAGNPAIRIVGRFIPRAFDLAGLVRELGGGVDPVVHAGAAEVLRRCPR